MDTFSWLPDENASPKKTPRLLSCQFGDGYKQSAGDGINILLPPWSVSFSARTFAEIQAMDAFLEKQGGSTTFLWTPPGSSTAKKFRCEEWTPSWGSTSASLTATFQQVPA